MNKKKKMKLFTTGGAGFTFCKKCDKKFILGTPLMDGICKKCASK